MAGLPIGGDRVNDLARQHFQNLITRRRAYSIPRDRGFTIIELIIVLVVIGLVTMFAIPRINSTGWRLNGAVREASGLLRRARQTAVRQQHDVAVSFDARTNSILVHENSDNDPNGDIGPDERVYRRALPEGIVFSVRVPPPMRGLTGSPVSFEAARVVFHSNGAASESGVIYLEPHNAGTALEDLRALWVERATGSVQIFRYRSGTWEPM